MHKGLDKGLDKGSEIEWQKGLGKIEFEYTIENISWKRLDAEFGVEFNLTFLAGNAPDRYYYSKDAGMQIHDKMLNSKGITWNTKHIGMKDEYLGIDLSLSWETVSQSEGGFERAYQGSSIMPHWQIGLEQGSRWKMNLILDVKDIKK
jgi:alpha-amylase